MSAIGVEIGGGGVAVCGVACRRGQWTVRGSARVAGQSPEAIREAFGAAGIAGRKVAVAAPDPQVIIKRIKLPAMSHAELAESIGWEAEQYVPFPLEDVRLGYQRISDDGASMEVLLFASRRDLIDRWLSRVREAGLDPVRWLPAALCAASWYETIAAPPGDRMLVEIGGSVSHAVGFRGGRVASCRALREGSERIVEALRERGLLEAAEQGPRDPYRGVDHAPIVRAVTAESAEIIAAEIGRVVELFDAVEGPIAAIDLVGEPRWLEALEPAITEAGGRPARRWEPGVELGSEWTSTLGLACGRYPGAPLVAPRRGFFRRLFG